MSGRCLHFAAKSKMVRRFVTLGPPVAVGPSRAAGAGAGAGPRWSGGPPPATVTEGAGPATGRDGAPKTRLDASEFASKSKCVCVYYCRTYYKVCVCLLLQDLLQSCARGGGG